MVYTVTFNPAIDYVMSAESVRMGSINRMEKEQIFYGGKGINVSIILNSLQIPTKALGFIAGFTGEEIADGLSRMGVESDFVRLSHGMSRINVKVRAEEETDYNAAGPCIEKKDVEALYRKLDVLKEGDVLVLAGSIPTSLPDSMYEEILEYVKDKKVCVVVDAQGELLCRVLPYHPFLIKPNKEELEEIFQTKIKTLQEVFRYAKKLKEQGARNVLVSLGKEGALLLTEEEDVYQILPPNGPVLNTVGAGDSMVAGFIAGYLESKDMKNALILGTAAGSATAFSIGLATQKKIHSLVGKSAKTAKKWELCQ